MLLMAAAAIAAFTPHGGAEPLAQARVTVRIVSAAHVHLNKDGRSPDAPVARAAIIRTDAGHQPAMLVEFE